MLVLGLTSVLLIEKVLEPKNWCVSVAVLGTEVASVAPTPFKLFSIVLSPAEGGGPPFPEMEILQLVLHSWSLRLQKDAFITLPTGVAFRKSWRRNTVVYLR